MPETIVTVKGLNELHATFRNLKREIREKIGKGMVKKGADILADGMRMYCPVKTGNLYKSIIVRVEKNDTPFYKRAIATFSRTKNADGWYAHLVEFGTKAHLIPGWILKVGNQWRRPKQPHPGAKPHPFVRPAFDKYWERAMQEEARYFQEQVEKIVKAT